MYEKLLKIQGLKLKAVRDTKAYNYKYATLEQIWDMLQPILQEEGIVVTHSTIDNKVCTAIVDDTGKEITSCMPLPENLDPQKLGSAVTYFRRYNLLQLFNIMVEDDDGESASRITPPKVTQSPFDAAVEAIEKCESQTEIDTLREQIHKSKKLTDKNKVQLEELLEERLQTIFNKI